MNKRLSNDESMPMRSASFSFERVLLLSLTIAPLLVIFGALDTVGESPAATVFWCVWVGIGAVIPWRYARRGEQPVWAGILAVICTLLLLWVLVLETWGLIQTWMSR
jgi:hypothetical protein